MKWVITGGAGFIGSNIAEELVKRQQDVVVIDNFSTGKRENIAQFLNKITLLEGSVTNMKLLQKAFKDADFVLHLAGISSVVSSINDPLHVHDVNFTGSLNVLVAARDAGVKKVIFSSSANVYGNDETLPKREEMYPDIVSPYGLGKLTVEQYCRLFHKYYGLNYAVLRYFNVFGPRQDPHSEYSGVIGIFINRMLKGEPVTIFGNGLTTRDFVYVKNVVNANILAATGNAVGTYNVGCGKEITLNELVFTINKVLNADLKPAYGPERIGDIKYSVASIERAKHELDYDVEVDFEEGMRKTIAWYSQQTPKIVS
ncbi:SDR family oxidoreductase [Candidatus Woesearchaeota archaeon]|nr:MAG: SDR family oxidoreductase [Candidatus Woesearchaeota archaeon]